MAKDRLSELKKCQQNSVALDIKINENESLRKTFEKSDVIGQWIKEIEKNTCEAKSYIKKTINVNFNQKDVQHRINCIFQNNTSIAQQVSKKLKDLDDEIVQIKLQTTEARIKNIQYTTLNTRFRDALLQNNIELENYKTLQKQIIKAQLSAKGNMQATDEQLVMLLAEGKDLQIFTENIIKETLDAKQVLVDVEERHQQLIQIERMLVDVKDMFLEMEILVDNQQELIDRIEYQAQLATDYIGAVDLKKVRKGKCKYLKQKVYCLSVLVVIAILILVLIFKS